VQDNNEFQIGETSEQKLAEIATGNGNTIESKTLGETAGVDKNPGPEVPGATTADYNIELQTLETTGPDEIKSDEDNLGPETIEITKSEDNDSDPEILKTTKTDDNNLESKTPNIVANREHVEDLGKFLRNLKLVPTRATALNEATKLWNSKFETNQFLDNVDDYTFFKLVAKQNGFFIYRVNDDFDLVKNLNLPAVLELYHPGEQSPLYCTLVKIENNRIVLRSEEKWGEIEISHDELKSYWPGVAYIPWRNHLALTGNIPTDAPKYSVIALKMLLNDIGFDEVEINPFYDDKTIESVKEVQRRHGIFVDGIVGPLTKIILYNEKKSLAIPHITG
jgi:general secretion pathway protein A